MSARHELAHVIDAADDAWNKVVAPTVEWAQDMADAILEAGYRKVITTKAELDALPAGTRIRDNSSESLIKDESGMWTVTELPNESFASWEMEFGLPAVVLLEGDAA